MMAERERQLTLALLDCAGVFYEANFTADRILGEPIQVIDGVSHSILSLIGKKPGCSWTEIVEYWADRMPREEKAAYEAFSDLTFIRRAYERGQTRLVHKFRTYDVLGNPMLAEQTMRLYEDADTGDLLGMIYVTNRGEVDSLQKKERELSEQYAEASRRAAALQKASINLPGGYHRCSIEEGYPFLFISKSFEEIVGYTQRQIEEELDNLFSRLVYFEDRPLFSNFEKQLSETGHVSLIYRIRRRDGELRWVQDSSLFIEWEGEPCLQCTLVDITDFVNRQEELAKENAEFEQLAVTIPCGYHRCTTDGGFLLEFVSDSFLETVGYSREEIQGKPFFELVAEEDRALFMSNEPILSRTGRVELVYRIRRKDGSHRWIKDSTMRVTQGGRDYYQCILADITDFVTRQEEIVKKNLELMQRETMRHVLEKTMPGGYHRCRAEAGCPITYIGSHFTDIVGWTREELASEFDNLFVNLLWEEDREVIRIYEEMLAKRGEGNIYSTAVYRVKHKSGGYRWVSDSSMFVDLGEESFFQAVLSDITPYIKELEEAKKAAEASNQAKSAFLFNASHDIRTPMNAIQGFAHMIAENAGNEALVRATVAKIRSAGETLMTLMNDILDLSRIERGKEEVNPEAIDLYAHELELYELFEPSMKDMGIAFAHEMHIGHSHVMADPLKLSRIGMNMLSNARKFTPRGGCVTYGIEEISSENGTGIYRFYARDTGIGMSEEFQKKAFEQFERERTSTESGVSGSGLGLSIIKRLADLMGGHAEIVSELGRGTEISVYLPLPFAEEGTPSGGRELSEALALEGKRVLLVEDNEFNREIGRYILEELGMRVEEAENGLVSVNRLLEAPVGYFDLVLMDLQMPIMDGYTATKEIRGIKEPSVASIPILAMTANAFEEDKQRCLAVGMNGHIGKPIDVGVLAKALSELWKK